MKRIIIAIIGLVLLVYAIYTVEFWENNFPRGGGVACTLEAKLCPDGSAVGRTGPNCEFAECPSPSQSNALRIETRIDLGASALDVKVIPQAILEDSRCPAEVQCIQAGTVRVRATLESGLGSANQIFRLGDVITTESEAITLVDVLPAPAAGVQIRANDYRFIFEIRKRTDNLAEPPSAVCQNAGGKWLPQYGECEGGLDANQCSLAGGTLNECASACRNDPNAQACIMLCVPVCQF